MLISYSIDFKAWAIKAAEAASVHMNLIMSPALDTTKLKLNKHQAYIFYQIQCFMYFKF
jgi:hypothetical protein